MTGRVRRPPAQGVLNWDMPVPFARNSDTGRAAAASMADHAASLRAAFLAAVQRAGRHGATTDEVCEALGLLVSTGSARANDLHAKADPPGIVDSGLRRKTRAGRWATVWVVRELGPAEPPPPLRRRKSRPVPAGGAEARA